MKRKAEKEWVSIGLRIEKQDKDALEKIATEQDVKPAKMIRDLIKSVTRKEA